MEDSEQRKKRLKEMRLQADQAGSSRDIQASTIPGYLSNPVIEALPSIPLPNAAPRFDFYTDPMSAFSSSKRRNANFQDAPDYSPRPYFGDSPMAQFSSPRPDDSFSPSSFPVPYRNPGLVHYNFLSHPSTGDSFRSPRFEPSARPLVNSIQGLTHRPSHSPNPSSGYRNSPGPGRGRGYWNNSGSQGSRRSGGRGLGSHSQHSYGHRSSSEVNSFYKQSMVEDPWNFLKPVLWLRTDAYLNALYTPETSKSWKPKSLSTKLEEGSSKDSVKPNSQPTLAEQLAAAINEATNST